MPRIRRDHLNSDGRGFVFVAQNWPFPWLSLNAALIDPCDRLLLFSQNQPRVRHAGARFLVLALEINNSIPPTLTTTGILL